MTDADGTDRVLQAIADRATHTTPRRLLVAVVGAPGSGKSTFAEALADALARRTSRAPAVVAQDGFHLDNAILEEGDLRAWKGAPETFDVDGLLHLLMRLRQGGADVVAPAFDRDLDIVRGSARVVPATADTIIVEGNYLLLDAAPWSRMRRVFDLSVMLTCRTETLQERLTQRWLRHGLTPQAAAARAEANDLRNARLVVSGSAPADLIVAND